MTRTRDVDVFDRDDEIMIGFGRALGVTVEKLAEICDSSKSVVHSVSLMDKVKRLEGLARRVIAHSEARTAEKVQASIADRMKGAFSRALAVSERTIPLAERLIEAAEAKNATGEAKEGDLMPILAELRQFHQTFTSFFARYQISEAPKRTQIEGLVKHDVQHTLSLADAANLLSARREIEAAKVIDVEPVS